MGLAHNVICCHRLHQFAVSLLILLISTSSQLRLLTAEGRKLAAQTADSSKTVNEEDKAVLRAQIGSRPPRCDGRCSSCGHCEAIQVPTNPQTGSRAGSRSRSSSAAVPVIAYARGDDNSNYKPMSWKCKCGNLIFNP
ncbi:UNVERIFIED_CONTAM: EPIDERMAL PATTERNING FACTOR-like protein 2 [Sesamum latifolium]|uniref:Epidermal patterning factor-like protein n=1 Tax=Sesamum latifolium TaxID=2727402 RepID=A0AAW2Y7V9_9LAMI